MEKNNLSLQSESRRSFLKTAGMAVVGGSVAYHFGMPSALGNISGAKEVLKVGLIGCGGRGTGAAIQAVKSDPNVILTAMGDAFEDRLEKSYDALSKAIPDRIKVKKRNKFIGFDAYQKVIDSGVDVVLLTTPPAFRPAHFAAAVAAGKHAFCEKPMAVDAPGVRLVMESARKAKEKNLGVFAGFCFRHDAANQAAFQQVLAGRIGDVRTVTGFRYGGELTGYSSTLGTGIEYQLRNWYFQNWLSGDFVVEVACHSADMMSWALGDVMPIKAIGSGGRQQRVEERFGNVFDHFSVEYEYAGGAKGFLFTRQQRGAFSRNTIDVTGTEGDANFVMGQRHEITGKNPWKFDGAPNNMFQAEHDAFFASIRAGKPINDGEWMANSTMMAILGRMAAYSGQEITWDQALNSNQVLGPRFEDYSWDLQYQSPPVAIPGVTKVL